MQKIITLSESIVAKISAGEVITRPAYAVKELVDNALDSHASVIKIDIEHAGLTRITVGDNGEGMNRDDLEIAFLPHTTSKLRPENELIGIKTLGFRGEALSSIAAVSTLTIRSRTHDQPGGTEIIIRNGQKESISQIGTPPGTIVVVADLFLNVLPRKKFLKSERTEFRLITDIVTHYALSFPQVHFVLTHNGKLILDLPSKKDPLDRLAFLLGSSLQEHLIPLTYEDSYIQLNGFIGKPQIATRQNQKQFLFINTRPVIDRLVSLAFKESYGTLLPASSTPIFILAVTLPPEIVDINVHPRKEQVAFTNPRQLFDAIKQAVTDTLSSQNLTFKMAKFKQENSARLAETTSFSADLLKQSLLPSTEAASPLFTSSQLLQIDQTYIVAQTKEGILLVDQHAAHERILYEKFITAFKNEKNKNNYYELPRPVSITLSVSDSLLLAEHLTFFEKNGFAIESFQGTTYRIRSVPTQLKGRNIGKIIRDILVDLAGDVTTDIDTRTQRMLSYLACRAAIKAGDLLTQTQMKDILKKLEKTQNNTTCPHGRPTRIPITVPQLDRLFKRQ